MPKDMMDDVGPSAPFKLRSAWPEGQKHLVKRVRFVDDPPETRKRPQEEDSDDEEIVGLCSIVAIELTVY